MAVRLDPFPGFGRLHGRRLLVTGIPAPSRHAQVRILSFESADVGESLSRRFGSDQSFTPGALLHGAQDHIIIAYDRRIDVDKQIVQKVLHFRLVRDEQIAIGTEPTGVIERNQAHGIDVNEQRHFPLAAFGVADWASGTAKVRVWV